MMKKTMTQLPKFKILEHKADLKIRVYGKTKKDLFSSALLGMTDNMKAELAEPEKKVGRRIRIKSPGLATLLADFLNEALYLSQLNREAYFDVKFKKFSDTALEGELIGKKIERFNEDIKAATYHGLNIQRNARGIFEAAVLFDI